MRKYLWILTALVAGATACEKKVALDHHISAEFPKQETLQPVSVLFAQTGEADILVDGNTVLSSLEGLTQTALPGGETLVTYKSFSMVVGSCPDVSTLLEATCWAVPASQWVYCLALEPDAGREAFGICGFVDCLKARDLEEGDLALFASSNTYDKINGITDAPVGFTVQVKEDRL